MGQKERDIINGRLKNLKPNQRLFRANCGMGWIAEKKNTAIIKNKTGGINIYLKNGRPFHGLPDGMPDLIGWESVTVTPEMVGQVVAVFSAIEIKTGKQKIKHGSDQDRFRELIVRMGGRHEVIG